MKLSSFLLVVAVLDSGAVNAQAVAPEAVGATDSKPSPTDRFEIGVRADCLHDFSKNKGESQNCLSVTGARLQFFHQAGPEVSARIAIDPYSTPKSSYKNAPAIAGRPDALSGDVVSEYKLLWIPRPHLEIGLESFEGSTKLPSVSGLALANLYNDTGWRQSAATITYNLSLLTDMQVKFAIGNGEGEYRANTDPQQYFGFRTSAQMVPGVKLILGVSVDGNNVGSDEYQYELKKREEDCGITANQFSATRGASTQRLAAAIELDGTLDRAKDLLLGLGYQRSVLSDLDKKVPSNASKTELSGCRRFDPTTTFVEDESSDAVNTVQRTLFNLNGRYRLTKAFFAAFDFSLLKFDTGSVELFETCKGYENGRCITGSGESFNHMTINTYTVGAGMALAEQLELSFEMYKSSYDKKYARVFFDAPDGKTSDVQEFFNARIVYNWK